MPRTPYNQGIQAKRRQFVHNYRGQFALNYWGQFAHNYRGQFAHDYRGQFAHIGDIKTFGREDIRGKRKCYRNRLGYYQENALCHLLRQKL